MNDFYVVWFCSCASCTFFFERTPVSVLALLPKTCHDCLVKSCKSFHEGCIQIYNMIFMIVSQAKLQLNSMPVMAQYFPVWQTAELFFKIAFVFTMSSDPIIYFWIMNQMNLIESALDTIRLNCTLSLLLEAYFVTQIP